MTRWQFFDEEELTHGAQLEREGYVVVPAEDRSALDALRGRLVELACEFLHVPEPTDQGAFLETLGERVTVERLNELRLAMIGGMERTPWFRAAYFRLARAALSTLVGNELCMQRRVNLSVQLPQDDSSLLPLHADSWAGDSPYELVLWVPWVDCSGTQCMYLVPPAAAEKANSVLLTRSARSAEELFQAVAHDAQFLELRYGEVLLFNQNLPHGNRVNQEPRARLSSNCRFKGAFTPYADKKLGEFFEPITLRAASRLGLRYELPELPAGPRLPVSRGEKE